MGCVSALLADSLGMSVLLIDSRDECSYRGNAHYLNGYSLEALVLCGLDIESLTRSATPESYAYAMSFGTKFSNILSRINLMDDDNVRGRYADAGLFSGALNVRVSVLHHLLIQQIKKTNKFDLNFKE